MTTLFAIEAKPYGVMAAAMLQALPLGAGLGQQLVPVVGRVAVFEHLAEHPVGVVAALAIIQDRRVRRDRIVRSHPKSAIIISQTGRPDKPAAGERRVYFGRWG